MLSIRRGMTAVVAMLAITLLALSGCARSGAAAAYVGGEPITDADLTRVSTGLAGQLEGQRVNEPGVLAALVKGELAREVAERRGIELSSGVRDQFIAQQATVDQNYAVFMEYLDDPDAAEAVYGFADYDLVMQRLGGFERFVAEAQQVGVELNPRYGDWIYGESDMGIRPDATGSLSTPVSR